MASATVGVLRVLLTANAAEFESVIKHSAKVTQAWAKDLRAFGQHATQVGQALTKALTVPILGLGAGAIKAASDFESSFAGVRKTVDATEPEFAKLAQGLRNMAKEVPANVNELNKVAEAAGQLGIRKEDILQFTRTMADLGVTTNLTADEAATATAQFQNIFGAAGKDVDRFGATLVALGNAGASTERDIIQMGLRIAGAGHQVGLTQGQVMAFASALSSVGINAEAGGAAISRVFLKINDAVAAGGGTLAEFARIAGMTSAQFRTAFESNAAQATTAFISGLARLKSEGENVNATLENVVGKNIILKDTLLRASGAGQLLTEQLSLAEDAWQANNALTKEAAERYKTFASQAQLLWNEVRDVGITLGTALLPVLRDLMEVLRPVIQAVGQAAETFAKLPEPVRLVAIGMLALFAAIGPSLWMLGAVASGGSAILKAYAALVNAGVLTTVATGIKAIAAAAMAAGPQLVIFAGAASAVIAAGQAIRLYKDRAEQAKDAADEFGSKTMALAVASRIAGRAITDTAEALRINKQAAADSLAEQQKLKTEQDAAAAAAKRLAGAKRELTKEEQEHKDAIDKLRASLFGADDIRAANDYIEALGGVNNVSKLTTDAKEQLHAAVTRALDAYRALGREAPAALRRVYDATLPLLESSARLAFVPFQSAVKDTSPLIDDVRASMDAMASIRFNDTWLPFIKGVTDSKSASRDLLAVLKGELLTTLQAIPQTLANAFTGGGDWKGALKAITSKLGSDLAKMGAAALGATGPWGQAIAGAIGSLAPLISKLWGGNKEHMRVNDLRDEFTEAAGGIDALIAKAAQAGLTLKRFWDAKTVKDYEAAIKELEEAFQRVDDARAENLSAASDLFNEIMEAGRNGIPASLQPTIQKLIELGLLTDDQIAKLRSLGEGGISTEAMESALDVIKGRIEVLGPIYQQQKLDETSLKYANAIQTLIDGGADVGGVLFDAREEISALVVEAIKAGKTLPANLKPWVDDLFAAGNLIDENGNKITDISGLQWGEEQKTEAQIAQEGWNKIIERIDALIAKLGGPLESALDHATRDRTIHIDTEVDPPTYAAPSTRGDHGFASGTIGRFGQYFQDFGSRFPTVLHGVEAVLRPQDSMPFAASVLGGSGGGRGGTLHIHVMLPNGRELADAIVPEIPSALRRHGI
ncbi:MAG: phage tail tape measure protein [Vicinamibacterales bacterium]